MTHPHFITAASITNLLSGLLGAIAGSTLSVWATIHTDKKSKEWNLKVELRKHRVARLVAANDGLRTSFYRGWTQLDYHLLALANIESDLRRELPHSKGWDTVERKIDKETERYNEQVGATEADARAHMSFLDEALIPPFLLRDMEAVLAQIVDSFTTDSSSVRLRQEFYRQIKPSVMDLLKQVDALIAGEIATPLHKNFLENAAVGVVQRYKLQEVICDCVLGQSGRVANRDGN